MALRFSVITIFPELVAAFMACGIVRKACADGLANITTFNPRDFTADARRTVDDVSYGGGPGMVMKVAPLRAAVHAAKKTIGPGHVVYLSPQGQRLRQRDLSALLEHQHLILMAGRYEGVDERVLECDVDAEWSIGDYVLSGGELPALVLMDAMIRLIPGALGDAASAINESFAGGLLDYPHYTRPEVIDGQQVPPVLLSGNHQQIAEWRQRQAVTRTLERRPDLLEEAAVDSKVQALTRQIRAELDKKTEEEG
ncbi:MAG: tRNA (guanosine(37)-N1)-methyltransferase TrmD [Gammaproteobacteria bacterium]|nr:tRNA (guanosine(37)-N1)-methyltransferase TrmD [Gammaproteobacteria bacterium]